MTYRVSSLPFWFRGRRPSCSRRWRTICHSLFGLHLSYKPSWWLCFPPWSPSYLPKGASILLGLPQKPHPVILVQFVDQGSDAAEEATPLAIECLIFYCCLSSWGCQSSSVGGHYRIYGSSCAWTGHALIKAPHICLCSRGPHVLNWNLSNPFCLIVLALTGILAVTTANDLLNWGWTVGKRVCIMANMAYLTLGCHPQEIPPCQELA